MLVGPVRQHRPDVGTPAELPFEHDVAPVRGPEREVIASGVMRQLYPSLGGDVHYIDILPTWRTGTVLAIPAEGQKLSVRRP